MTTATKPVPTPKNTINPGVFGKLVIGESEPQQPTPQQLLQQPDLANYPRPKVEGGEWEKEQAFKAVGGHTFGPLVAGASEPQKPTPTQLQQQPGLAELHGLELDGSPKKAAVVAITLAALEAMLEDNPYALNGLMDAEFRRAEGPRKNALRLFLKIESASVNPEPRPEVIEKLQQALKE